MNAPRRISRMLVALGSTVIAVGLLVQPAPVGATATHDPAVAPVAAEVGTVTLTVSAVGFMPTGIEIYDVSDGKTFAVWCMAKTSCSLPVPVGNPTAIKVIAPVQFSLACPAGSNTDGPGLIDGSWYGWCGTAFSSPIIPTADLTIVVTATSVVPPTALIFPLPTWLAATSIPLDWAAMPGNWPVASFDVRFRRAAWNGGFGSIVTWKAATADTSATFTASSGYTYCFSVRARDTDGGVSTWTAETCTAIPLDDRSLVRSSGCTAGTGSSYYRSTYLRSSTYGAKLTRTVVVAKRIALLATTCATCGSVKVYWGTTLLKTVSHYSATTVHRKLLSVASFSAARTGSLTIKVSSSGKRVIIDGVAIRRN